LCYNTYTETLTAGTAMDITVILVWIAFIMFFVIKFALLGFGAWVLFCVISNILKAIFAPKVIIIERRSKPERWKELD
jgi:hypothetical protein